MDKLFKQSHCRWSEGIDFWDAMTPHDVTTIYNLILILTM